TKARTHMTSTARITRLPRLSTAVRAAAALAAAALTLATAPAAMASAGDDAHVVYDTRVLASGLGSDSRQCPTGERGLSGGAIAPPGGIINVSGPLDETGSFANTVNGDVARYWYTAVSNPNVDRIPTTFYAVCSPTSDATIQVNTFTVTGVARASATV